MSTTAHGSHTDGFQGDRLTTGAVQSALAELRGGRQALELCAIINAFDVPKISYDPVGRKLYADIKPRAIFAPALVRVACMDKCFTIPCLNCTWVILRLHLYINMGYRTAGQGRTAKL